MRSPLIACLLVAVGGAARAQDADAIRDDATGRARARALLEGQRSPELQLHYLQEAAAEAQKYAVGAFRLSAPTAVSGSVWVNVGPASGSQLSPTTESAADTGRVRRIVPHPTDPNILYVATAGGGVWKSFDATAPITVSGGPHWTSITSGLGSQSVGAFAIDPSSPDTLFLGLGDPFDVHTPGFYTSLDGGISWQGPVGLTNGSTKSVATSVRDIVVDPSGSGVVLVATDEGLFRQIEGGAWTWKDVGSTDCWSVAWVAPSRWLASCYAHVYLSTDNAVSFNEVSLPSADVGRMTLAAAPSDRATPAAAYVYILAANAGGSAQSDIFLSRTGGATWQSLGANSASICIAPGQPGCPLNATQDQPDLDVIHDQAWYNQAIIVDPRDHAKVFVAGNLAMMRSDDAGQSWRVLSDWLPASPLCSLCRYLPYVHADFHTMAVGLAGTPYFYAGTDGGIFRSADAFTKNPTNANDGGAPAFEGRLGRGLVTHLAYSIATDIHDSTNPAMIGGLQDNGTRLRTASSPTTFNQVIGADGFGVGIGRISSNSTPASCAGKWGSLLLGSIYGVIYRSIDCGASFASAMNGICKPQSQILNPAGGCAADYDSNFFMKLASDQADSTGLTFLTVINNSACDPNQPQCALSVGTNSVYVTHDGAGTGTGWVKANGNLGNFSYTLTSVSTNPKAPGQWAVTDAAGYAYVTGDGGAHWAQTAQVWARYVTFEDAGTGKLWAASPYSAHVYRSADGGASWVAKNGTGLPDVPANVIAVDPNSTGTVYLGTEIGLYRTTDGGQTWSRHGGSSLPLVSVTEINVALDSSAIRISTFGRGFWELYPGGSSAPAGVLGNGDLDHNQVIDAFDLVREAAILFTTPADPSYDPAGNLTGATNTIDASDFATLAGKIGSRP